jgi:PAS domain S-box-containing protein
MIGSVDKYQSIFERSPVGIFQTDAGGRMVSANPALARILGFPSPVELLEQLNDGGFTPYTSPGRREEILRLVEASGRILELHSEVRRPDGRTVWISENIVAVRDGQGRIERFDGIVQDITTRKKAFDLLLDQSELIRLLEEVAVAANSANSIEHVLQYTLDRVCSYMEWPLGHVLLLEEATGELVSARLWHMDRPAVFEEFRRVTEGYRFRTGVGLPGRVLALGKPAWITNVVKDPNFPRSELASELGVRGAFGFPVLAGPKVVAVLEFFIDSPAEPEESILEVMGHLGTQLGRAFERRKAEQELRAAMTAAESASTAKSHFLANMSHELRTPLNSVIGFAAFLLKNKSGTLQSTELTYLERIQANGKHLLGLIDQVLDLSKVEAGEMKLNVSPTDLGRLVRETVDQLRGTLGERPLRLATEIPDGLRPIDADPDKLRQVLINLLGNALKFTERGSVTVRITAEEGTLWPTRIEVIDTGIGIPADRREAIFNAFQQVESAASRKYGGTGLGLTISRSLCRLMGYRIQVESEVGRGSTFTIYLV